MRATFGSKTAPLTRKQAERVVRNPKPVAPAPAPTATDARTFGAVLDEWLSHGRTIRGSRWAPVTANTNRGMVEYRIKPVLGQIRMAALAAAHLQSAYDSWAAEGLSDNTVHRLAALIKSALSFAMIRDYINVSPAAKVVAPAATKGTKKIPTANEVSKLLTAAEAYGKDMDKAITISSLTGARAGEVAALRWKDIDLKRGTIVIDKSATEVEGLVSAQGTKTGDERIARVEGNNLLILQRALGTPGDPDTYVIDGKTEPVNPGVISDRFVSVRGLAHIKNISFHQLRKFYATTLSANGVPAKAIADIVGWKSTRMLDIYVGATKSGYDAASAVELLPVR
jgi:integrase